jgi:DNA-binding winged helix-turn-helix (wHTH) protein
MSQQQETAMLIWMDGERDKGQWSLAKPVISIGRWEDNDVVVRDRWVSRYHARICRAGERHVVHDLGSKNGTLINGRRIAEPTVLDNGDKIRLAPSITLVFINPRSVDLTQVGAPGAGLEIEVENRRVRVRGTLLTPPLSRAQFAFLALLAEQTGRVCSRGQVVSAVWPDDEAAGISDGAIDALVRRTRLRLREVDPNHQYVVTVRGYGFRLETNDRLGERPTPTSEDRS